MLWLSRQPKPEPEEDDDLPPPFGVHPLLDVMAVQYYLIRQQRDIWRAFVTVWRRLTLLAGAWALMGCCWLFIALVNCYWLWRSR